MSCVQFKKREKNIKYEHKYFFAKGLADFELQSTYCNAEVTFCAVGTSGSSWHRDAPVRRLRKSKVTIIMPQESGVWNLDP